MKKIYLFLLLLPFVAISQSNDNFSVYFNGSNPVDVGIRFENVKENKSFTKNDSNSFKIFETTFWEVSYSKMKYEVGSYSITGSGGTIGFGRRYYFNTSSKGFYLENSLSYSRIKFRDDATGFNGVYQYFSFTNPNMGYKWWLNKKVLFEPYIGATWKIQFAGTGDIDNVNVNPWILRFGARIGLGL